MIERKFKEGKKNAKKESFVNFARGYADSHNYLPMNKNVQIRANDNGAKTHILSNPTKDTTGNTIWDCVYFGNYYQNDVEGKYKEPIKWRVLKVDGNDAFLLADKGLDVKPWHESGDGVDWETCTLRSWLNGL